LSEIEASLGAHNLSRRSISSYLQRGKALGVFVSEKRKWSVRP